MSWMGNFLCFQFQLCHQVALFKCQHTFSNYGHFFKKIMFRFLKDGFIIKWSCNTCQRGSGFSLFTSLPWSNHKVNSISKRWPKNSCYPRPSTMIHTLPVQANYIGYSHWLIYPGNTTTVKKHISNVSERLVFNLKCRVFNGCIKMFFKMLLKTAVKQYGLVCVTR